MSMLEEIRAKLQQQRHAIITETNVTVFPLQEPSSYSPYDRAWTHAVTFTIIPRREIVGNSKLNLFMDGIADACGRPGGIHCRGFSDYGYGRAQYWENIGTVIEQHSTTVAINDPEVPLTENFNNGVWVDTKAPTRQTLVREITLSFCPYGWLPMMVHFVESEGSAKWMHEPTADQLEQLKARRYR